MANRLLFLMRHAEAVTFAPGLGDIDRPLSSDGREQAGRAASYLGELGVRIDGVLCSAAVRTKETAGLLGLSAPVRHSAEIYNAGSDTIRELVGEVDDELEVLLVVGHAPGIPTLAHDLADDELSDADALRLISQGYPPATLVGIEVEGSWTDLRPGRLAYCFVA
ncbi:histidine phosphatase family protein [Ammonicoccus fulvus]|uniref:Histidine phosphatase family protein n=1 Tax=Ammonicoccus fulvus TaxID=3138240 RepID=A0ABZ3FP89_9ACTN